MQPKRAKSISDDQPVASTLFKARPGELPYNASEVVSIGDSRFLFCDNNISDAAFENAIHTGWRALPSHSSPDSGCSPASHR